MPDQDRIDYEEVQPNYQELEKRIDQLEEKLNLSLHKGRCCKPVIGTLAIASVSGIAFWVWKNKETELRQAVAIAVRKTQELKTRQN